VGRSRVGHDVAVIDGTGTPSTIEHSGDLDRDSTALTLTEASRITDVGRRSLRKQIDAGCFAGAYRDDTAAGPQTGRWRIPVIDLVNVGYVLNLANLDPRPATGGLGEQNRMLQTQLELERARRIAAEGRVRELEAALEPVHEPDEPESGAALTWQAASRQRTGLRGNWLR
jgi:hypothetical protein